MAAQSSLQFATTVLKMKTMCNRQSGSRAVLLIAFLAPGLTCVAACSGWKGVAATEQDLSEQCLPS